MDMLTLRTREELREVVRGWRRADQGVAVVPTMGALHEGHASLVRIARARAARTIATIFVNPRQFNAAADLASYPSSNEADAAMLAALGVDLLYAPDVAKIYPEGFDTTVSVQGVSQGLCGAHRPGHFDGVATVVTKLFLQTAADFALFGEKDFQQLHVVRRLALDLDIPTEIVAAPTIREPDGLALSSRNAKLSPAERRIAPALARALFAAAERLAAGAPLEETLATARARIVASGYREVEYLELRAEADLMPLAVPDRPARLLAAARLGEVRLIDNVPVVATANWTSAPGNT